MNTKSIRWSAAPRLVIALAFALTPALSYAHPTGAGLHQHPSVIRDHSSRPHTHESVAHH